MTTTLLRRLTLALALAALGVIQPLASAWACDPCPTPKPPYSADMPDQRP
jgi:hypothetical protein